MAAYDGLYETAHNLVIFLYLTVPPNTIDINIHQTEIKFDDEHALYAILRASIKHSLGQFNVAPVLDFDRDANLDTPIIIRFGGCYATIQVDGSFNPFWMIKLISIIQVRGTKPESTANWESLYVGLKQEDFISGLISPLKVKR
jgi:DNA mismatch repair protein MutL